MRGRGEDLEDDLRCEGEGVNERVWRRHLHEALRVAARDERERGARLDQKDSGGAAVAPHHSVDVLDLGEGLLGRESNQEDAATRTLAAGATQ